jgi:hypothetical protein
MILFVNLRGAQYLDAKIIFNKALIKLILIFKSSFFK